MANYPKLIFGGGTFMDPSYLDDSHGVKEFLDVLDLNGIKDIDTATTYFTCEQALGNAAASSRFSIHTKYPGGLGPEPATKESVIAIAGQSLEALKTDQIPLYYLHAPDKRVSLEETLSGINELHQAGKFKQFGLSNFLASEVEEVISICRAKGYVLPTVYQGTYSVIARRAGSEILPTLRKHNIAFYAYSPIAGGMLAKDVDTLTANDAGRWDPSTPLGGMYHALYYKPKIIEALKLWDIISKESGISKVELAYRWVVCNSDLKAEFGDGVIIGARSTKQLQESLDGLKKGALPLDIASRIEEVWKIAESESPLDNWNDCISLMK